MQTRLRETSRILMKALENWQPFLKGIEETISMLEGDVENLTLKKKNLETQINEQIKASDAVIRMDKDKVAKHLVEAEFYLKNATEIYLELYKMKATKLVAPESYAEKLIGKSDDLKDKIQKKKEEIRT